MLDQDHLMWIRSATPAQIEQLALAMIAKHPSSFAKFINQPLPRRANTFTATWGSSPYETVTVTFSDEQMKELKSFSSSDRKISCIKMIREMTGLGLKEAKELSENRAFCKAINAGWNVCNG